MKSNGTTPKNPTVERQIDENLRRVYQQMVDEEVPDKFMQLLQKLKEQDPSK
ncbi:NepR family anti-sigma factor [Frigidibacter oleivorans]|uniref:NepR family anti-sigma factor n=1 Tax=Frigidibacter oleivorans TaxID=2487129 RepID=UPI000F8DD0D9|nr:NepR family anti-sigma factor [Frigidibacter oleivorans]